MIKQFTHIKETSEYLKNQGKKGMKIGFVPTMGALHEGHLMLVKRSKLENDLTVCSIFVNPIQFNNPADLEKYPRTLENDLKMLEDVCCDVVFTPEAGEMYPEGEIYKLDIDFGSLDKVMEGKFRPGHFEGVAKVVKKLFDIVAPDRAYFGKKDYQQLAVITSMVKQLNLPLEIIPCETVREPDGLAMSSRNTRLTSFERSLAPRIYQVLLEVRKKAGHIPVEELKEWAITTLHETPELRAEYFEIGHSESLMPLADWDAKEPAVAFAAVFLGEVRLIDNIELFL
jgi:pantoate--beta-alanine ligase